MGWAAVFIVHFDSIYPVLSWHGIIPKDLYELAKEMAKDMSINELAATV